MHKLRENYRRVHSSIGLYSPSWTYMGLDFSPQVAAMEGFYNPSLTCMPYGFSPDCIALHVRVPFAHNSNPLEHGFL